MRLSSFFSAIVGLAISVNAVSLVAAQDMKITYVDLPKLFDQYEKTKLYDKQLEADNTRYQDERNKKIDRIRELQGKSAMVKDVEKKKIDDDVEKLKSEVLEFDRSSRTDLTKARDERVREILLEIEKTVSEYAKREGISYVFKDQVLIYGVSSANITDPILKMMNDTYKASKK